MAEFDSESEPGTVHRVHRLETGDLWCSCPGFEDHGKCWHVDAVAEGEEL